MSRAKDYTWLRSRKWIDTVGRFFETLAASMMRARPATEGNEDLAIRRIGLGIEVKSGDNNRFLRIPVDQYQQHQDLSGGFPNPYDDFVYCLFCYNNRQTLVQSRKAKRTTRRSLLASCKSELDVYSCLARNVDSLYVLHAEAIEAFRVAHGVKTGSLPCEPERQTIEVGRKMLKMFTADNAATILAFYSLNLDTWIVRERLMNLSVKVIPREPHLSFTEDIRYSVKVKVIEVMPRHLIESIDTINRPRPPGKTTARRLRLPCSVPRRRCVATA